jgi:hypothetical protein
MEDEHHADMDLMAIDSSVLDEYNVYVCLCKNSPEFLDYAIYNICRNSPEFLDYAVCSFCRNSPEFLEYAVYSI